MIKETWPGVVTGHSVISQLILVTCASVTQRQQLGAELLLC